MTNHIPEPFTQEELNEWYKLQEELKTIKEREMELRKKIFAFCFPSPVEGTNSFSIADGFVIKGKHTITREVQLELYDAAKERIREAGVILEELVKWKPTLVLSAYRKLTDDQRNAMDMCLQIKPGSPAIEIVKPKR